MTETAPLAAAIADRYTLDRELGRGGMATVYLARDIRHDRLVALKVLHPELGAVLGAERFLSEIRTTANLQHPNILPLFDSGAAAGLVFYVMPYVTGETLRDKLVREGQLSVNESVRLARGVAAALDYAHRQGVVHRDIKPENILLQDGQPIVADFGIALAVSNAGGTRITQTGLSVGTPAYMSPEQAAAERQLDGRSDQYSLASVLYELLAGEPPFTGASVAAVMSRLMTEVPRRVDVVRPAVPAAIADALARALEKVPADRHETVAHFASALSAEGSSGYRAAASGAHEGPWKRRALVIGAFGTVGIATALVVPRSAVTAPARAPRFYSIALPESLPLVPGRDKFGTPLRSLDVSDDGSTVAYTTGSGDSTRIVAVNLESGATSVIANTLRGNLPAFSADGRSIAFMQDSLIRRIEIDGTGSMTLGAVRVFGSLMWGRDGRVYGSEYTSCLSSVPENGGVVRIDSAAGCPAVVTPGHQLATLPVPISVSGRLTLVPNGSGKGMPVLPPMDSGNDSSAVAGDNPILVDGRYLVFVRDSTLFGAPIDLKSRRLASPPRVLLTGVRQEHFPRQAHLVLSADGTLVWVGGGDAAMAHFVRVRLDGTIIDTLPLPATVATSFAVSRDGNKVAWSVPPAPGTKILLYDIARRVLESYAIDEQLLPWSLTGRTGDLLISAGSGFQRVLRLAGNKPEVMTMPRPFSEQSVDGRLRCYRGTVWYTDKEGDAVQLRPGARQCRFSDDGSHVAVKGEEGIFVAPTATLSAANVVRVASFGDEPRWTGSGRGLIFRDGDRWYDVAIDKSGRPMSAPRLLFSRFFNQAEASWALDVQDRIMVLQGPPLVRTTRINVLTNFPRFLAEKLK
ncbi:protein kinase domain-containing protein [Gemmatimonas sp.]|uniref:protein kinase domain-containing protein n=1 Tax=Gemmatimonas sp. TaxID=1962908 RepID=UPI00398322BF